MSKQEQYQVTPEAIDEANVENSERDSERKMKEGLIGKVREKRAAFEKFKADMINLIKMNSTEEWSADKVTGKNLLGVEKCFTADNQLTEIITAFRVEKEDDELKYVSSAGFKFPIKNWEGPVAFIEKDVFSKKTDKESRNKLESILHPNYEKKNERFIELFEKVKDVGYVRWEDIGGPNFDTYMDLLEIADYDKEELNRIPVPVFWKMVKGSENKIPDFEEVLEFLEKKEKRLSYSPRGQFYDTTFDEK